MLNRLEEKFPIFSNAVHPVRKERTQLHTCGEKPFVLRMLVV